MACLCIFLSANIRLAFISLFLPLASCMIRLPFWLVRSRNIFIISSIFVFTQQSGWCLFNSLMRDKVKYFLRR